MTERVVMAGFGGQGIMAIGKMLAYAGMLEDKEVTWIPSYGPEMRGGTAFCSTVVSSEEIDSPVVTNDANSIIVMNLPSMDKFEKDVLPGGNLFINRSLIERKTQRDDINAYYIPANDIATELGSVKAANMVMLGAYLEITKTVKSESVLDAFIEVFGEERKKLLPLNEKALLKGAEAVRTDNGVEK